MSPKAPESMLLSGLSNRNPLETSSLSIINLRRTKVAQKIANALILGSQTRLKNALSLWKKTVSRLHTESAIENFEEKKTLLGLICDRVDRNLRSRALTKWRTNVE